MIAVGVVHRVHRGRRHSGAVTGRRHRRTEAVVVEAIVAGAAVVAHPWAYIDDHPRLGARTIPVEGQWLKVLESGEGVEFATHFGVGHDGVGEGRVRSVGRNLDGNSLDAPGADLYILLGVGVAVVGVKVDVYVTPIGVVADVLHIVVDRDGVVAVHHARL